MRRPVLFDSGFCCVLLLFIPLLPAISVWRRGGGDKETENNSRIDFTVLSGSLAGVFS
jgi:hypothetical protein